MMKFWSAGLPVWNDEQSGGRDIIDHPQGGHDDVANVITVFLLWENEHKQVRLDKSKTY
jgi:hypothetical protein